MHPAMGLCRKKRAAIFRIDRGVWLPSGSLWPILGRVAPPLCTLLFSIIFDIKGCNPKTSTLGKPKGEANISSAEEAPP